MHRYTKREIQRRHTERQKERERLGIYLWEFLLSLWFQKSHRYGVYIKNSERLENPFLGLQLYTEWDRMSILTKQKFTEIWRYWFWLILAWYHVFLIFYIFWLGYYCYNRTPWSKTVCFLFICHFIIPNSLLWR